MTNAPATETTLRPEVVYQAYLDAFIRASGRVRFVLVATVVASILVFVGAWNSWTFSWQFSRISHLRTAVDYQLWNPPSSTPISPEAAERIKAARRFLEVRKLTSERAIRALHEHSQRYMVEHVASVAVPFLGIELDVNDLGIFGGFAFTILMLWAAFSIYQVKRILEVSERGFERLMETDLAGAKIVYHSFAMAQLFGGAPTTIMRKPSRLRWLPRLLFVLPLLVLLAVTLYDVYSADRAGSLNYPHTWVLFICEAVWGVLLIVLLFVCITGERDIDRIWSRSFETLLRKSQEKIPLE